MAKKYPVLTILLMMLFVFHTLSFAGTVSDCKVISENGHWWLVRGGCLDGLADGEGRAESEDGSTYEGGFDQGKFDGYGRFRQSGGVSYEGYFRSGQFSGYGKILYPDGSQYAGDWQDGQYHGRGNHTRAEGSEYQGQFANGVYHGEGKLLLPDGSYYLGTWHEGELQEKTESNIGQESERTTEIPVVKSDDEKLMEVVNYTLITVIGIGVLCLYIYVFKNDEFREREDVD